MTSHPSAMVRRPGLMFRLLDLLVFRRVPVEAKEVERLREVLTRGDVVYVTRSHSVVDYLFFNWLLLRYGLPLCDYCVGISTTFFRPLVEIGARIRQRLFGGPTPTGPQALMDAVRAGRPAFLFLGKPRTLTRRDGDFSRDHIQDLLHWQSSSERSVLLVPLLVMWRPRPQRLRPTFVDAVLGGAETPGRIRKLFMALVPGGQPRVDVGEPVDLRQLGQSRVDEPIETLARKVRGAIHIHLERRVRVAIGPRYKSRARLISEILRSLKSSDDVQRVAERLGRSVDDVLADARAQLNVIAADFRWRFIKLFYLGLSFTWNRIYEGIEVDEEGFEALAVAARERPLILLPSHKSHIDYLVLSWLFVDRGLMAPHIAAGDNLNFFPLGTLFRRSGAFFLRRSFRGDALYPIVFKAYMRKLLREGYSVEFFLEGGRSRSGKILHPRLGLLSFATDAVLDPHGCRDVCFVPVSVGYERVVEASSFEREHAGRRKRSEGLKGLLGIREVLRRRYGSLYVEFGSPVPLRRWLEDRTGNKEVPEDQERARLLRTLGYDLAWNISAITPVTPVSLVATVLLGHPRQGLRRRDLLAKVAYLQVLASRRSARFSRPVRTCFEISAEASEQEQKALAEGCSVLQEEMDPEESPLCEQRGRSMGMIVDEAVSLMVRDEVLEVYEYGTEQVVYRIPSSARLRLDYYRNSLVPLLVSELIVGTAVLGAEKASEARDIARWLSKLLKQEFVFRVDAPFEALYEQAAEMLEAMGLVLREKNGLRPAPGAREALGFLREALRPYLEAYLLAAQVAQEAVDASGSKGRASTRELIEEADRRYQAGEISLPEACSGVTLKNASRSVGRMEAEELTESIQRLLRCRGDVRPR